MNPLTATLRPSQRFAEAMVMLVAVLGTAIVYLDQTAVTVALPTIQSAFNASLGGLQWVVDIYILTLGTLLLIGGALGDRYGRVRVYIIGMATFVVTSIACGAAPSPGILLGARAAQGAGGALLVPAGLAIINATAAPERRGRLIGTWATFTSMVIAFGPSLGGWLVDAVSWRAIFFLNVPLGLLACYVGWRYVPESRNEAISGSLDWAGVITLMLGLGGLLFGLIEGPHFGWAAPPTIAALAGGILGLVAFMLVEKRSRNAIIPLHLFRNRNFSGINLVTLLHWMGLSGVFFFLTLNLQQVQGYSALAAGLAILPISLSIVFLSRPSGRWSDRFGPVPLMVVGMSLTGLGFMLLARLRLEENYWNSFFPALLAFGIGVGLTVVPVTTIAMGALPNHHSGIASGVNNAASRVANMLAIAIFGAVLVSVFQSALLNRVADIPLDPAARTQLLAHSRELAATPPPEGLTASLTSSVTTAIQEAFLDSFRVVMLLSAVMTILSLVSIWLFIRYPATNDSYQNRNS